MSNIPEELWNYAKNEYDRIEYGEVRIIANESGKGIDVITEKRKRFEKEYPKTHRKIIYKKG